MLINSYYYAPHNHTFLDSHLESDLNHMVDLGVDAVSICVQETQLMNWHQKRLTNVVERIKQKGMLAFAIPNRWAGLTAGWLDGFGTFSVNHPETWIHGPDGHPETPEKGNNELLSCIRFPIVREHIEIHLDRMFNLYPFDGIIWDEPHSRPCYCSFCKASGETPEKHNVRTAAFLDGLNHFIKARKPKSLISIFVQPHEGMLLKECLPYSSFDFVGSDGHIRHSSHVMHRMKGTIFDAHREFYPSIVSSGRKSFFLLEAQRHRNEDLQYYLQVLDEAFALPMDHLMFYYSAHEMGPEQEKIFNEATWNALSRLRQKHPRKAV
jgi:hypothetical protein